MSGPLSSQKRSTQQGEKIQMMHSNRNLPYPLLSYDDHEVDSVSEVDIPIAQTPAGPWRALLPIGFLLC